MIVHYYPLLIYRNTVKLDIKKLPTIMKDIILAFCCWFFVCSVSSTKHILQSFNRGKSVTSSSFDYQKLVDANYVRSSEAIKFATAVLLGCTFILPTVSKADILLPSTNSFSFTSTSLIIPRAVERSVEDTVKDIYKKQSKGWELARQKRTVAIKSLEQKGIVSVETDEVGNQFLALPWIPDKKIPYKSLSMKQRLLNEVCAGAFGEISKDALLHAVDTAKTRRQVYFF
jgi:hypothetical protein